MKIDRKKIIAVIILLIIFAFIFILLTLNGKEEEGTPQNQETIGAGGTNEIPQGDSDFSPVNYQAELEDQKTEIEGDHAELPSLARPSRYNSPDGTKYFIVNTGGEENQVSLQIPDLDLNIDNGIYGKWNSTSEYIVFTKNENNQGGHSDVVDYGNLWVINYATGEVLQVFEQEEITAIDFAANADKAVFTTTNKVYSVGLDGNNLQEIKTFQYNLDYQEFVKVDYNAGSNKFVVGLSKVSDELDLII